ncbi:hypothetical protein NEPAR06_0007 [Nematocida parisii]|uniref:Uncharacterized protein n=1 Tax=Nematocida parisii (strain ERTm3) TaxID=935791 RepID=I3EE15_NEMP3|nr:uncharacterized protein NEPG_00064 [Nematocida parisii ERTm1]EIJ87462.1 hypothetical protein NEQG_02343 [Nematocida parisii ERTm3]KAI5142701.1 hypothetical protein NEPAR07_0227 [Nematocida parisii]EIJ94542.1 hypothetical protein NEPG_00064 [Nematocida parisii ERTm1]KAI5152886.1 hypothetical protein NEPAR06_0007 [Nematocida parisii]KAI5157424.1 hypothetical protein NEPAR05_1263 [Nematocida parisii]|eukprot:XP_013057898.1 hypothetical protein NEPG_00064 [Nematocida parisii ERTm1]
MKKRTVFLCNNKVKEEYPYIELFDLLANDPRAIESNNSTQLEDERVIRQA